MRHFEDETKQRWNIHVTAKTLIDVKAATGRKLLSLIYDSEAVNDPNDMFDCLWPCCQKQAAELKLTRDEFADRLNGDSYAAAVEALLWAITDFFPQPHRERVARMLTQAKAVGNLTSVVLEKEAREKLDRVAEKLQKRASGDSSGDAPATAESPPGTSLSES